MVGSWYWTAHVRTTMEDHNMRAHMRTLGQGSWAPHAPILVVGLIVHGVDKSILDCIAHDCRNVYTTTPVRPTTTAELLYLIGELHQTNKSLCITVLLFFNFAHNSFFFTVLTVRVFSAVVKIGSGRTGLEGARVSTQRTAAWLGCLEGAGAGGPRASACS